MNPIALHQSTVHPLDPVELVEVARAAGLAAIGLRVATIGDEQEWWSKGIGSAMLRDLAAALQASGVTVLDVGRIELGPELRVIDSRHPYMRALELGVRLGARFVTVRARAGSGDDPADLFTVLAELAGRFQMRPLLAVVPGTAVDDLASAVDVVRGTDGGVVLDVSPRADDPAAVATAISALGPTLGYVRVPARELADPGVGAGMLSTLPPEVTVAIGGASSDDVNATGPIADDHVARVTALRHAVDSMLASSTR